MTSKSEILTILKSLTQHLDEAVSTYLDNADDDEFGQAEADETGKLVEEAKVFIARYEAEAPTRISKSEILTSLKSLTCLIEEALTTHIYDDFDKIPEDDSYVIAVNEAGDLIEKLEAEPPTRVIVIVEGGMVVSAHGSDSTISFAVLDKDDWEDAWDLDGERAAGDPLPEHLAEFQALSDEADSLDDIA